jgi:hypothetical protein
MPIDDCGIGGVIAFAGRQRQSPIERIALGRLAISD